MVDTDAVVTELCVQLQSYATGAKNDECAVTLKLGDWRALRARLRERRSDPVEVGAEDPSAVERYFEHMGPTCDHHSDECPPDCPRLAQRAEEEYRVLRARSDTAERLLGAIRKHRDQRGDDRCWLDDEELYALLPEGFDRADLRLCSPDVMVRNCLLFIAHRHNPALPYISPQRRIDDLEAEVHRLKSKCAKLFSYTRHRRSCRTAQPSENRSACTCGLSDLYGDVNVGLELPPKET